MANENSDVENLFSQVPERERRINIWKSEIEYYERMRRQNGASVIAVKIIPISEQYNEDKIQDYILENLTSEELYTQYEHDIALIDVWGKDLITLIKKCERIRNEIPKTDKGTKAFELEFALVGEIPFAELHFTDALKSVLHRVLTLLNSVSGKAQIAHDFYPNMRKNRAQNKRMEKYEKEMASSEDTEDHFFDNSAANPFETNHQPSGGMASSESGK